MSEQPDRRGPRYRGESDDAGDRAIEVLQALRDYRVADAAMRRRSRDSMSMGENDLIVLRYLITAKSERRQVSSGELAKHLGVTTASMTAMIDRLERSGHVCRERHRTDGRSILVVPTAGTDEAVRQSLGEIHGRMRGAVIDMTPDETRVVVQALARMRAAVDQVASDDEPDHLPPPRSDPGLHPVV